MRIFGREPTVIVQALSGLLTILVGFGLDWLTADQATAIIAALTALAGALNALAVKPWAPPAFVGLAQAVATLVTGYGLDLPPEVVASITAAIPVLLSLQTRAQVTPNAAPMPRDVVVG